MTKDEEELDEEEQEEETEPEYTENTPTEKFMVYHTKKGQFGSNKPYYLDFIPDREYLEKTFGSGLFTILDRAYSKEKKKIVWSKIQSISINEEIENNTGTIKKNPRKVFAGNANEGMELLQQTGAEIREMALSKLIMAFANTIEKGDYEGAKAIGNVLTGNNEQKDDRYQKLIDKLIDRTLTAQINPVENLQDQIKTLKSLKGLMDAPEEKKDTWAVLAELADKHLPSIMQTAEKNSEVQKEMILLKEKEAEARTAAARATQPVNTGIAQPQINPVTQKPPILDRFLMQILRDANETQLQGLVSLNLDKKALEPMVKNAFNVDLMPDQEYNELCELFETKRVNVEITLKRLNELSVNNQKLKNLTLILSTTGGKELLKKILEIVESYLFAVGVAQTNETVLEPLTVEQENFNSQLRTTIKKEGQQKIPISPVIPIKKEKGNKGVKKHGKRSIRSKNKTKNK